jgi:SAM-dependent methyltransferase
VVLGVDLAPRMIELATQLHPTLAFRIADVEMLPFAEGSFDAIVCNFGIGHFPRPERAVEECVRVLVGGGRLGFSWWDVPERTRLQGVFIDALHQARAIPPPDMPTGPPLFRFSAEGEFAAVLRAGGLRHVVVQGQAFTHCVSTSDALWTGALGSLARTAAIIRGQTAEVQQRIRAVFDRWYVPTPARMVLRCPWPSRSPQAASPVVTSDSFPTYRNILSHTVGIGTLRQRHSIHTSSHQGGA